MIHPSVEEAIDQIDAAFFSGDTFRDQESAERIGYFLRRWQVELASILNSLAEEIGDEITEKQVELQKSLGLHIVESE